MMKDQLLVKAILKLRPAAEFSFTGEDYSSIVWTSLEGNAPSKAEINKAIAEIEAQEIADANSKESQKAALLVKLGITADEAKLLLS
jgi:hypothetical protein